MNDILSFIGIGQKANIIRTGEYKSLEAIKFNKCYLIVLANDSSINTKKKFENLSKKHNIETIYFSDKLALGSALGKEYISVFAVTDKKFSDTLKEKL
ncbi:L7Ae/L30e/S12e/Gadd45 family ribosomal protein [Senegalia massiliensis]|uniref:L7Ae/L30e/S12e/Gadd45 family ribosomal protein n=1 Tax=Senegalia massiliensis TaxID=1720316 RepID=UPI0010322A36|nr:ribosomal L7Ae/L30e/S12e/Gadd45 family protein [Senegalia massiliensis]